MKKRTHSLLFFCLISKLNQWYLNKLPQNDDVSLQISYRFSIRRKNKLQGKNKIEMFGSSIDV